MGNIWYQYNIGVELMKINVNDCETIYLVGQANYVEGAWEFVLYFDMMVFNDCVI